MPAGYHRIHLVHSGGDWITLYVPLDEAGRYDPSAPKPHLLKVLWDGEEYLGELFVNDSPHNRIEWAADSPDSLTDILKAPICVGSIVRVWQGDTVDTSRHDYSVKDVSRV